MMDKHLLKEGEGRVGDGISHGGKFLCVITWEWNKRQKTREILENIINFCFTCAYERDGETRCINGYLFIPETQCLDLRKEIDILFLFVWQWSF